MAGQRFRAHIEDMIIYALKLAASIGLVLITTGAWPNPRYGAAISIGVCVLAALTLHFFAP
jgi:hypothetical protein